MIKKTAFALTLAAGLATAAPALAFQCPAMMAAIDQALPAAQISEADRVRVIELRAEGEAAHNAGNHPASEAALAEAMALLGID